MSQDQPKSDCCGAAMKTSYGDEGTGCWLCANCGKPCDPTPDAIDEEEPMRKTAKLGKTMQKPNYIPGDEQGAEILSNGWKTNYPLSADAHVPVYGTFPDPTPEVTTKITPSPQEDWELTLALGTFEGLTKMLKGKDLNKKQIAQIQAILSPNKNL